MKYVGKVRTFRVPSVDDSPSAWTAADDGGWISGLFDAEGTAIAAVPVATGTLAEAYAEMQQRVNHVGRENRLITMADLEQLQQEKS